MYRAALLAFLLTGNVFSTDALAQIGFAYADQPGEINLRDERLSREELQDTLESLGPADLRVTPDIELEMDVNGELLKADDDMAFNDGKGELTVSFDDDSALIQIQAIEQLTILRVDLLFSGVTVLSSDPGRMAKSEIPFDHHDLHDGCFQYYFRQQTGTP